MRRGAIPKPTHVPHTHTCLMHVLTIVCIKLLVHRRWCNLQLRPSRSRAAAEPQPSRSRAPQQPARSMRQPQPAAAAAAAAVAAAATFERLPLLFLSMWRVRQDLYDRFSMMASL